MNWSSKKQNCIALSLTEAEYIVLTRAIQEGIWLWQSLLQLYISCPSSLVITTDNQGAKCLSENDLSHSKAKHINIHYYFICSYVENRDFDVWHTLKVTNTANLFMKLLPCVKFQGHLEQVGYVVH